MPRPYDGDRVSLGKESIFVESSQYVGGPQANPQLTPQLRMRLAGRKRDEITQ